MWRFYIDSTLNCALEPVMHRSQLVSNPFILLMNPQAVLDALEKSERLGQLASRICRPLDKVTPSEATAETTDSGEDDVGYETFAPMRHD